MFQTLVKGAYKHGYLFITAAWLYTLSFIISNYWSANISPSNAKATLEKYLAQQEHAFTTIAEDTTLVHSLVSENNNENKKRLLNKRLGVFTYQVNDLDNPIAVYWNTHAFSPGVNDLSKPDGSYFVEYQNGFFELLKRTITVGAKPFLLVGLIPIKWNYFKQTKYLKNYFVADNNIEDYYDISKENKGIGIRNAVGKILFYIRVNTKQTAESPNNMAIAIRIIAVLFLLLFINALARELSKKISIPKGFSFLILVLILFRIITYFFHFPFNFRQYELFDPAIYASSNLHPSLGDLLINVIIFFWVASFIKFSLSRANQNIVSFVPEKLKLWISYLGLILITVLSFYFVELIISLVADSSISFDVTNFFSLDIYTVISFVIITFLIISFYHITHALIQPALSLKFSWYQITIIILVTGLLILTFNITHAYTSVRLVLLVWLGCYIALILRRKKEITTALIKSSFFIFWIMGFSISVAVLIITQNRNIEIEKQKKFAEKLASQSDPAAESLFRIAITSLSDDFLTSNFPRLRSEFSNNYIKDSIISANFSGYLNKYDTHIYTFDQFYQPLFNEDSVTYSRLKTGIKNQKAIGEIPGLYYFETPANGFGFLYEKTIQQTDSLIGRIFIVADPRKYASEALYPELFKEIGESSDDADINYSYAIYNKLRLVNYFNDYNFPVTIQRSSIPVTEFELRHHHGYNELWHNVDNSKVIIVVKMHSTFIEVLTLFAYLFCSFLAVVLFFHLGNFLLRIKFRYTGIKRLLHFNIRTQIQITIIAVSIFSFVIIGIATISFFMIRFDKNNQERLLRSMQIMAFEIERKIQSQLVFDDAYTLTNLGNNSDLGRQIMEVSEIHNVDVNFYDKTGKLSISTQPYIYNKHVVSNYMEPKAYQVLHYDKIVQFIQQEKLNNFDYLSIYVPLRDESGSTLAYLNVPYLNSQTELNRQISNFLVTLINLNAFIFVIAGIIALLVTDRITLSFSFIADKMKRIALGKANEEIVWDKNDEIGVLIQEYNKMVKKLEESAITLAKNERESAWREMAKQVAHEIKNPLTPMKLSIQYLQKAVDNNASNVKDLSRQVASTLVQQIDQLAKIASDFSQFANINDLKVEQFDIGEVLQMLVLLHKTSEHVNIDYKKEAGNYNILADKTQINRLFTNLIKNAIEASQENEISNIKIHQYDESDYVVVSIKDNGEGIPEDRWDKIFVPSFTTKSSGTGLGLAICRGIVEKANGKIWFKTKEGEGTTFFISIPISE